MVKIRLRRVGAKKQPSYRVVVADSRAPRDGRFIETIGHYDPRTEPPTVVIYEDRALYWLGVGAQPSEPVERFFGKLGLREKLAQVHGGARIEDVAAPRPKAKPKKEAAPEAEPAPKKAPEAEAPVVEEPVAEEPVAEEPVVEEPVAEAPVAEAPVAMSLSDLGLSARVVKALEAEGITDGAQLAAKAREGSDALLAVPGVGAKAVEEIEQALADHGLAAGA